MVCVGVVVFYTITFGVKKIGVGRQNDFSVKEKYEAKNAAY